MSAPSSSSPSSTSPPHVLLLGSGLCAPPFVSYLSYYGINVTIASRTKSKSLHLISHLLTESQRNRVNAIEYNIDADQSNDFAALNQLISQLKSSVNLICIVSL